MTKNLDRAEILVLLCEGSDCKKKGSRDLRRQAKRTLKEMGFAKRSKILRTRCTGNCKQAPICGLLPQGEWLARADAETLEGRLRSLLCEDTDEDDS